jgi:hypothetical protein
MAFAIVVCVIGCCIPQEAHADMFIREDERFECVYSLNYKLIYVDTETNVMYFAVVGGSGLGLTVMVDETGAPLLWNE